MTYESIQPGQTSLKADLEHFTYSAYLLGLEEDINNPILALDSRSRTAFLLHHLFAYKIEDATALAGISEEEFRKDLRSAYLQLTSFRFRYDVYLSSPREPALA